MGLGTQIELTLPQEFSRSRISMVFWELLADFDLARTSD